MYRFDGVGRHPISATLDSEVMCPDAPGDVYQFNRFGYRSAEPKADPKFIIYVVGCSHTFGTGIADHQRWSEKLACYLAEWLEIDRQDVDLQNFSQSGASNTYITRTILAACEQRRPDLVIIQYTHAHRAEFFSEAEHENIGPWSLDQENIAGRAWTPGIAYYATYSNKVGNMDLIKKMMLCHFFLRNRDIPYIFSWVEKEVIDDSSNTNDPDLAPLIKLVRQINLVDYSPISPDVLVDASSHHPGPISQDRFAARLFHDCKLLALKPGGPTHSALKDTTIPTNEVTASGLQFWGAFSDGLEAALREQWNANRSLRWSIQSTKSLDRIVRSLLTGHQDRSTVNCIFVPNITSFEHSTELGTIELDRASAAALPARIREIVELRYSYETDANALLRHLINLLCIQEMMNQRGHRSILFDYALKRENLSTATARIHKLLAFTEVGPQIGLLGNGPDLPDLARRYSGFCRAVKVGRPPALSSSLLQRLQKIVRRKKESIRTRDPNIYPLW